jgi:hypothetical protein
MMAGTDTDWIGKWYLVATNNKVVSENCLEKSEHQHYEDYFYHIIVFRDFNPYITIIFLFYISSYTEMDDILKHIED